MPPTAVSWWTQHVVAGVDHQATLDRVMDESSFNARYAFMIVISAGISILGLLLPSTAVLIGAMLISPLMMPIMGLGFGLATFDLEPIRRAAIALALGSLIAILLSAAVVALSPLQAITSEIAIRTKPNLFELAKVADAMTHVVGDIRDLSALQSTFDQCRPEIVFHMAAQSLVRHSYQNPVETYAVNVMGTVHLLEAVHVNVGRVFVSTLLFEDCERRRHDYAAIHDQLEECGGLWRVQVDGVPDLVTTFAPRIVVG